MVDDIRDIIDLFFERTDTFPIQRDDGTYRRVERELTDEDVRKHLAGEMTIGSYTLGKNDEVRWLCFDFDGPSHSKEAKAIFDYLKSKPPYRKSCALESTGGRGSHCWLFLKSVKARTARILGRRVSNKVGVECEIYPKQDSIGEDGYGNLVKLPFGKHRKYGGDSFLVEPATLSEIEPAEIPLDVSEALEEIGDKPSDDITQDFIPFTGCLAMARIGQGVSEGGRNEAGFFRARVYFMAGLSRREAKASILAWNSMNKPQLPESEVEAIIDSVYKKRRYTVGSWSIRKHPILGKYCSQCINPVCEKYVKKKKSKEKKKFRKIRLI